MTIIGTAQDETLTGTSGDDTIEGREGDDHLVGGAGNDALHGGNQGDFLAGDGDDVIEGGPGDDLLNGGAGSDAFVFARGDGHDTAVWFEDGIDRLRLFIRTDPNAGDASLPASGLNEIAQLATVTSGTFPSGAPFLELDFGNGDRIVLPGISELWWRNVDLPSRVTFEGSDAPEIFTGADDNDTVLAAGGDDLMFGGLGDDRLEGGAGNDLLNGGAGSDWLNGWTGADIFVFAPGSGRDEIAWLEDGIDRIDLGAFGFDSFAALEDAVEITAATFPSGAPYLTLDFGGGDRLVVPGIEQLRADHVILAPTPGTGPIVGTNDHDELHGTAGDDVIIGGAGSDIVSGNGGHDVFVIRPGAGQVTITDFMGFNDRPWVDPTESDSIRFEGAGMTAAAMRILQSGEDVVITFDGVGDTSITLKQVWTDALDNRPDVPYGFIFDGESAVSDSFDTLLWDTQAAKVWQSDTVTFLSDQDNEIAGRDDSDDVINGQGGADRIMGLSGDDILRGDAGHDFLDGGEGNDTIDGGSGADEVSGGAGDDRILLGKGDVAFGNGGNDLFEAGGDPFDEIQVPGTAFGGDGDDTFRVNSGDNVYGGDGNDIIELALVFFGGFGLADGEDGNDTIIGGEIGEELYGGAGDDTINGREGNDFIVGGDGNDRLFGNTASAAVGIARLHGDAGDDFLSGGFSSPSMYGGDGNDTLTLGRWEPTFHTAPGILHEFDGGTGFDTLRMGAMPELALSADDNVRGIERIEVTGPRHLTVDEAGVLGASDETDALIVTGGADGRVTAIGALTAAGSQEVDGQTHDVYLLGTATLLVNAALDFDFG